MANTFLSINDVTRVEGDTFGPSDFFDFVVTRSGDISGETTVRFQTVDGTALSGADYGGINFINELTFAPGETTKLIFGAVFPDTTPELTETYFAVLSNPVGATIVKDTATVTIIDNDNTQPDAVDDFVTTDENTVLTAIDVLGNDIEPDSGQILSITDLDTSGTTGLVSDNGDGTVSYDPNGQFEDLNVGETAIDSFTYTVADGFGGTDTATVEITINGVGSPVNTITGNDSGRDVLEGTPGDDLIKGLGGNDILTGKQGNDTLEGGAGTDQLAGEAGADVLDGGSGNDMANYRRSNAGVTIDLAQGTAAGGHAEGDTLISIERLRGSAFDDELTGDAGRNTLIGEAGDDTLRGGAGRDALLGGAGADEMYGGSDIDMFTFRSLHDSLLDNMDMIGDLEIGRDRINGPNTVNSNVLSQLGEAASLTEADIQAVLSASDFVSNGASTFTVGSRTFLAINDGTAGFAANSDAVIEITGFTGNLGVLRVI